MSKPTHDDVVMHACPEYSLTPEQCVRAESCAVCGIRRDEHADQSELPSAFPKLDITDHAFRQYDRDEDL